MIAEVVLRLAGVSLILLSALHLIFPARFEWPTDLAKLTLLNRQIFVVHCFFICLFLTLTGLLCALRPELLLDGSPLARLVTGGLAIFWFFRLLAQWCFYDWSLWRGKRFETTVHLCFTLLWITYCTIFALPALR